jgi:hypothetical protein
LQHIILRLPQAIALFQLQPFVDHLTSMQLIPDATKTAILQPYIGAGKGLIPSSGAWFWSEELGSLLHLWHYAVTLKWDMGILLTNVTHGVCDPKELRATTSCGHILCLGSGLSSTPLFAGRPRH